MEINLRNCKVGDTLISSHGARLIYVSYLGEDNAYPHEVMFTEDFGEGEYKVEKGYTGTRIDSGHVFRARREPFDHDIVKVIPKEEN